jgi:hypothetical protein
MSKMPLDWHRKCLENKAAYVEATRKDVERRVAALERSELELLFYRMQVAEAEKRGVAAFDRDRLLVKHK